MLPRMHCTRPGFTLLEIILSLLILSVITAFLMPEVIDKGDQADAPRVQADLMELATAIELFRLADGNPTSSSDSTLTLPITRMNCRPSNYIAIAIQNIDEADFEELNDLIDGDRELDGDLGSQLVGQLRYTSPETKTVYFLVRPCR